MEHMASHFLGQACFQGSEAEQGTLERSTEPDAGAATNQDTSASGDVLEGYDPYSFSKEMEKLDEMGKTLEEVKQKFNQYSMRSLRLNADVVTMFDPVSSEELKSVIMSCKQCADRIAQMQAETIETYASKEMDTNNDSLAGKASADSIPTEESGRLQELMGDSSTCSLDPPTNED